MESQIVICSHAQDINGTQQSAILRKLELNLKNYWKDFKTLVHSMNKAQKSFLYDSETQTTERVGWKIKFSVFRYIYEILLNVYFLRKEYKQNSSITYIWIDPLNAISWVIGKKMGYIQKNIFYTPDYSPQKFKNKILDFIYHKIDSYSARNADEVWNVSSRITKIRDELWVEKSKNIFLPNVPWKIQIQNNSNDKYALITSGTLNIHLEYKNLISAISWLKDIYPGIKLSIAWEWDLREEIEQYITSKQCEKNVILLGFLDMQSYLQRVSECGIWLAMYNWKWWFNYYWDSTKCREFMYFGLPILTTSFHSTADEIKNNKVWIIDDVMSVESYVKNIKNLFEEYETYSTNSKKLWEKNNTIYTKILWNL